MKFHPFLNRLLLPAALLLAHVQADNVPPVPVGDTHIVGPIADGTPSAPMPPHEPLEISVQNTLTKKIDVEMAPELAGLPTVKGTITATVQMVDDPGLPDPPPPLPILPVDDAAVQGRIEELRQKYRDTRLLFVSAEVVNREYTKLTVYPNGKADEAATCFSNLDFENFSGFSSFKVKGAEGEDREYSLIMGIGLTDTTPLAERLTQAGQTYQAPSHPALPSLTATGPGYVMEEGSNPGSEVLQTIEDLHSLFRVEGERMVAARIARTRAYEERKAFLLANPPQPKDVTIRFWKRAQPVQAAPQTQQGGDQ